MDNELTHYGVVGMKWGIRRFRSKKSINGKTRKSKGARVGNNESAHEDYKKAHTKKDIKSMSDTELRARLNRIQMEKQYSKLSDREINQGKVFIEKGISTVTTIAAITSSALTIYNNIDRIKKILKGGS